MDDGRIGLHLIKRGWRWVEGTMQYCLKWELEDGGRDLLEVTIEALNGDTEEGRRLFQRTLSKEDDQDMKEDDCWGTQSDKEHLQSLVLMMWVTRPRLKEMLLTSPNQGDRWEQCQLLCQELFLLLVYRITV